MDITKDNHAGRVGNDNDSEQMDIENDDNLEAIDASNSNDESAPPTVEMEYLPCMGIHVSNLPNALIPHDYDIVEKISIIFLFSPHQKQILREIVKLGTKCNMES